MLSRGDVANMREVFDVMSEDEIRDWIQFFIANYMRSAYGNFCCETPYTSLQ